MFKVWIVGKYVGLYEHNVMWEFIGVFLRKKRAIKACRDYNYFIAPVVFGEEAPEETTTWPGLYYPRG
jgi:hypothetical protein